MLGGGGQCLLLYLSQLAEAESYEDRSAIRQAIRKLKKQRGENVGLQKKKGGSVYNRFAGAQHTPKKFIPKSFIPGEVGSDLPVATTTTSVATPKSVRRYDLLCVLLYS